MKTNHSSPTLLEWPLPADAPALEVTLAEGLIGCEMWRRFTLAGAPEAAPLMFLNSIDEPELSFIVADPRTVLAEYQMELSDDDLCALGHPAAGELAALVILNTQAGDSATRVTANLLGPVAVHLRSGAARQVIQPDYPAHYPLGELASC